MPVPALHVGYYDLNSDTSLNFQLNRWLGYSAETLLPDMRRVAARLTDYQLRWDFMPRWDQSQFFIAPTHMNCDRDLDGKVIGTVKTARRSHRIRQGPPGADRTCGSRCAGSDVVRITAKRAIADAVIDNFDDRRPV